MALSSLYLCIQVSKLIPLLYYQNIFTPAEAYVQKKRPLEGMRRECTD